MFRFVAACFGFLCLAGLGPVTCDMDKGLEMLETANTTCHEEFKDSLNFTPELTMEERMEIYKKTCFSACMLEKLGILADSVPNMEGAIMYVNVRFPESVRPAILDGYKACFESNGAALSKEDNCKSYVPLMECIAANMNTIMDKSATEAP